MLQYKPDIFEDGKQSIIDSPSSSRKLRLAKTWLDRDLILLRARLIRCREYKELNAEVSTVLMSHDSIVSV